MYVCMYVCMYVYYYITHSKVNCNAISIFQIIYITVKTDWYFQDHILVKFSYFRFPDMLAEL